MEQSPKEIFITALNTAGLTLGFSPEKLATISAELPKNEAFGDWATSLPLSLFTKGESYNNPLELAQAFVQELKKDSDLTKIFAEFSAAAPGFINATVNESYYRQLLHTIIAQKDQFGRSDAGKGKTAIVDLSAPNIAKRFSIGHLRSTIIGDAIVKLLRFRGWTVIGDNHLGDWGTQFGKMIVAIRMWAMDKPPEELTVEELENLYVRFHTEAEKNPDLDDRARAAFKALEDGDREERILWQTLVTNSMKEFTALYDLLDVHIDEAYGESSYEKIMPEVIDIAKKKGVAVESQGALIIPFPQDVLPPGILRKSDGATTYFTRDLATIYFRKKTWHPDKMIYEIGAEQTLHMRQVFWAGELLGFSKREECVHIAHGFVRLKEGRMSTRRGNAIKLDDVVEKIIEKAKTLNADETVATIIGIGALKYNDLKRTPAQGYTFDWDEALTLNGNSGPYLQYMCVRCKGILEKAGTSYPRENLPYTPNPEEKSVVRLLLQFPEVVRDAAETYMPSTLCTYLYELAQKFSSFYEKHSVNSAENQEAKAYRLHLTTSVFIVLTNGLTILGIRIPEKM